jgi:hypothetical protein
MCSKKLEMLKFVASGRQRENQEEEERRREAWEQEKQAAHSKLAGRVLSI